VCPYTFFIPLSPFWGNKFPWGCVLHFLIMSPPSRSYSLVSFTSSPSRFFARRALVRAAYSSPGPSRVLFFKSPHKARSFTRKVPICSRAASAFSTIPPIPLRFSRGNPPTLYLHIPSWLRNRDTYFPPFLSSLLESSNPPPLTFPPEFDFKVWHSLFVSAIVFVLLFFFFFFFSCQVFGSARAHPSPDCMPLVTTHFVR